MVSNNSRLLAVGSGVSRRRNALKTGSVKIVEMSLLAAASISVAAGLRVFFFFAVISSTEH